MMILVPKPLHNPENPISLQILPTFSPNDPPVQIELSLDTIVSAGCETMAQKIPAKYPDANVTDNYVAFEYVSFG